LSKTFREFYPNFKRLRKVTPKYDDSQSYFDELQCLKSHYEDLRNSAQNMFATADEKQIIATSKCLIRSYRKLLECINKSQNLNRAVLIQSDSTVVQKNCRHCIEMIIEALRSVNDVIRSRETLLEEVGKTESELHEVHPRPLDSPPFEWAQFKARRK
jgi:hypothetical protein